MAETKHLIKFVIGLLALGLDLLGITFFKMADCLYKVLDWIFNADWSSEVAK